MLRMCRAARLEVVTYVARPVGGPDPTDRAELERLRAEVAALRARSEAPAGSTAPRWRSVLGSVLIVFGSVLLLPATVAVWLDSVVTDTDRYVATVSPLADDPAVQAAVTRRVTDQVAAAIDVEALVGDIADGLSERGVGDRATTALRGLSGPLASGLESWLDDQVEAVVRSDAFAEVWTRANRAVHAQVVGLLTDDSGGALVAEGDRVSLELGPVVDAVKQRLAARGVGAAERIPAVDSQFVVVESEHLSSAQRGFAVIDRLGLRLSVVAVTLMVAGVLVTPDRRRAVMRAGIGAVAAMVALGVVLAVVRPLYVDALPEDVDAAAARAVFDQVVGFLRTMLRAGLVVGLVIAAAAFLMGSSRQAATVRSGLKRAGATLIRRGGSGNALVTSLRDHKRAAQALIAVAAVVVFVFWAYPSAAVFAGIALVTAALAILVEIVATPDGASEDLRKGDQEADAHQEQYDRAAQHDPGQRA